MNTIISRIIQIHRCCSTAFLGVGLAVAFLLLSSCAPETTATSNTIMVSIEPLRYVTEYIAGDKFEVETVTPRGASPETYSPTVQQVEKINNCLAFIRVGTLGFENTHIQRVSDNSPHLYLVNASEKTRKIPMCDHNDEGHHHEGEDPHTWMSPRNMKIIALNIYKALCHLDYNNSDFYKENLLKFDDRMNEIDSILRATTGDMKGERFLINHPSLGHLACHYGLEQLTLEHDGKEPSPKRVAQMVDLCKEKGVKKVFIQQQHSDKMAKAVAKELGLKVYYVNPLSYDWEKEILNITKYLQE